MARGCVIKRKTKFSNFSASYYVPGGGGKRRMKSGFLRKKDAQDFLRDILGDIHHGTYREPKKATFKEFADRWIEDHGTMNLKPSTFTEYSSHLRNHLLPAFGHLQISQIDKARIRRWLAEKIREGKVSTKTIKNIAVVLHKLFEDAVEDDYLRQNPANKIKKPRHVKKQMEFLTPEEVQRLLDACHPDDRALLLVAVFTGLRQGEILGLQWGDLQGNGLYVRRSLYWHTRERVGDGQRWILHEPKSEKSKRTVDLTPELVDALAEHRKKGKPTEPTTVQVLGEPRTQRTIVAVEGEDFIFPSSVGTPQDPKAMLRRVFFPALAKAGLRRIRFHDLRHTYVALQILAGANAKYIQQQLGHASYQFTMDQYGGLYSDKDATAAARLQATVYGTDRKNVVGLLSV